MTPPLCLRDQDGGREIVALDEELVTVCPYHSSRVTVFLNLEAGLLCKLSSRCVNKRRVTAVTISPAPTAAAVSQAPIGSGFREIAAIARQI